jgi:trk system potassium uptake protein TrkA
VRWTADQMLRRLLPEGPAPLWRDPTGEVILAEVQIDPKWVGAKVSVLEDTAKTRVTFLNRMGEAVVPDPDTVIQDGDVVHVMAVASEMERINEAVSQRPEEKAE